MALLEPDTLRRRPGGAAREVLDRVGIGHRAEVASSDLSHGEQRQLEIAVALATEPRFPWEGSPTAGMEPVTFRQCIEMATMNGARTLGLENVTGSLTPGKRADLILIRGTDLNVAPVVDPESIIVRSVTPANVDTVMIDGRLLKRGGKLLAHDTGEIVARAEESAKAVRSRAGGRLASSI